MPALSAPLYSPRKMIEVISAILYPDGDSRFHMCKSHSTGSQILVMLKQAGGGLSVPEVCREQRDVLLVALQVWWYGHIHHEAPHPLPKYQHGGRVTGRALLPKRLISELFFLESFHAIR